MNAAHLRTGLWAWARGWIVPVARGIARARTLGLAAEMSFWLFLSLVPLAAIAGLLAARVVQNSHAAAAAALSAVPRAAREMVEGQVEHLASLPSGGTIAPASLITFVWLASNGVHSVFDALEVQIGAFRPWWKKRIFAIATCIGMSIGVAILALLAAGLDRIAVFVGAGDLRVPTGSSLVSTVLRAVLAFVVAIAMIAVLYGIGIPREARHAAGQRTPLWPGSIVTVVLFGLLGWAYGACIRTLGNSEPYLGSLAVVGVTLMTLWLFAGALLVGAQVNEVIGEKRAAAQSMPR
ncbi:MAG: YihY/virulence factor BrkB family protein [Polyangiaceae bacterium]